MSGFQLRVVGADHDGMASRESSGLTLRSFFELTYIPHRLAGCSPRTRADYSSTISKLDEFLNRTALVLDVVDNTLSGFSVWLLNSGVRNATVNKHLVSLKAFARFAWRSGVLGSEPSFALLPRNHYQNRCWTREEIGRIVVACRKWRPREDAWLTDEQRRLWGPVRDCEGTIFEALVRVMYETGVRLAALMAAHRSQFDERAGVLHIRAEHQKDREDLVRKLSAETCERLVQLDSARTSVSRAHASRSPSRRNIGRPDGDPSQRLLPWVWDQGGHPWKTLRRHFARILKAAGLSCGCKDQFHKIRRTYATYTAIQVGLSRASELLGHSHVNVTRSYIDWQLYNAQRDPVCMPPPLLPAGEQKSLFD